MTRGEDPPVGDATLRMLRRLFNAQGRWVETQVLVDAMYGHCVHGGPNDPTSCIAAFVHRVRATYGRHVIESKRCCGYRIPAGVDLSHVPGLVLDERRLSSEGGGM